MNGPILVPSRTFPKIVKNWFELQTVVHGLVVKLPTGPVYLTPGGE